MKRKKIVCISREYGSGGRDVAQCLSKMLDIPFYDKEILTTMCKNSGIDVKTIERINQDISKMAFYFEATPTKFMGGPRAMLGEISLHEKLYETQKKVIQDIALHDCIIVGRASGYILRDNPDTIRVFIRADVEDKKKRVVEEYGEENVDVEKKLMAMDQMRANYYNYFSNHTWGKSTNYDLIINTSKIGIENTAKIIIQYLKDRK